MIMLSIEENICIHIIIYCSNNENDLTFHKLKNFVSIPIIFVKYVDLNEIMDDLIEAKNMYFNTSNLKHELHVVHYWNFFES